MTHSHDNLDDMSMLDVFKIQTEEHIKNMNQTLLVLEKEADNDALIDNLFREAHTLKGAAKLTNVMTIQEIAHHMEDLFGILKNGQQVISSDLIDLFFEALDTVQLIIDSLMDVDSSEIEIEDLVTRLKEGATGPVRAKRVIQTEPPTPQPTASEVSHDEPVPAPVAEKAKELSHEAPTPAPVAEKAKEPSSQKAKPAPKTKPSAEKKWSSPVMGTVRVATERLDNMMTLSGDLYINKLTMNELRAEVLTVLKDCVRSNNRWKEFSQSVADELKVYRKDEKFAIQANDNQQLSQSLHQHLFEMYQKFDILNIKLSNLTEDIQTEVMESRMLPALVVFDVFPRAVRDLAREFGKSIELTLEGERTPIDKAVLEQIKDPIMHLVRNACDHGIETPEERESAGKHPMGSIRLSASQEGTEMVVSISDDGRGMDSDAIAAKVVAANIMDQDSVDALSRDEKLQLAFINGLSTREKVTQVSGRGVGLDVVKNNIEKIQGLVDIETQFGQGTHFRLRLPLTLAVTRCLLVRVGTQKYGFPVNSIVETMKVNLSDIKTIEGKESINYKGQIISLVRMASMFAIISELDVDLNSIPILVLGSIERRVGVTVDQLIDQQEVVTKPIDARLGSIKNISSATILNDGSAALIIDIPSFVRSAIEGDTGHSVRSAPSKRKTPIAMITKTKRILVVEDSLTIRELIRKVLKAAGYRVETAVDGMDGLNKLSTEPFDLVVTDIDMPRKNGFEMTEEIKADVKLKSVPVIIISYKEDPASRRKGLQIGADAYLVKSKFDNEVLLEHVARLIG